MTVYFLTAAHGSRYVTMRAAMLLANADVVVGESDLYDELASLFGHNAEQICFAPGVGLRAYIEELHAVLRVHAHDSEAIVVRLLEDRTGTGPNVEELAAIREFGSAFETVTAGTTQPPQHSEDHLVLPRRGPLIGIRVVVPRARHQAAPLGAQLLAAGATPIVVPVIDVVEPLDDRSLVNALNRFADYAWIVFTSQNAVTRSTTALGGRPPSAAVKVAAVGRATATALEGLGWHVDLVPQKATASSLVEQFPSVSDASRVLYPTADIAGEEIEQGLSSRGYRVDRVVAYRTIYPVVSPYVRHRAHGADAIIFTSPSTVTGYLTLVGRDQCPPTVISIGPSTSERAHQFRLEVTNEASSPSLDGTVDALIEALESPS